MGCSKCGERNMKIIKLKDIRNIEVENKIDDDYTKISFNVLNESYIIEIHKSEQRKLVKRLVKNLLDSNWKLDLNVFINYL